MKFALSSDWHPDWQTLGVSRFDEIAKAARHSAKVAVEAEVSHYIFTGDLADPTAEGGMFEAINLAADIIVGLANADITVIFIAGNHDVCTDGSGATTLTPLRHIERYCPGQVYIVERPSIISMTEEFKLMCLPFTAPSHAYDPAVFASKCDEKTIVAAHLTVPGIHPGSETTDMPRGREIVFPFKETKKAVMRINGHYHQRQNFDPRDGGPLIHIPGSLARLGFGEEDNNPAFSIIEVSHGEV